MAENGTNKSELFNDLFQPIEGDTFENPNYAFGRSKAIQVGASVCYIVAGIIMRGSVDDPEICLVQEAKNDCKGQWYLPAGRVEPGETLTGATKREVVEESGLLIEVEYLLGVEVQGGGWYRFSFFCTVMGALKSSREADKHSLSSEWFIISDIKAKNVALRSKDILSIIDDGLAYYRRRKNETLTKLPVKIMDKMVPGMFFRLVIMRQKSTNNGIEVMLSRNTAGLGRDTLPLVEFNLCRFAAGVISQFYREVVEDGTSALWIPSRLLGVQCLPTPSDGRRHGLCLTLLCVEKSRRDSKSRRPESYQWTSVVDDEFAALLKELRQNGPAFHLF